MNTYVPFVIKNSGDVTMYINGESVTVAQDHPNYRLIVDSLKTGRYDKLESLVNIAKAVKAYVAKASDHVKITDGVITYDDTEIHSTLTSRIFQMMNEGYQFDHMLRFFENLMQNPSKRAVQELYTFLENYGLPITDDGCFLAYKAVRPDYFDIWTGHTHKNIVGSIQKMARNLVDDDWGKDCSQGLHCGALNYVIDYGHFVRGQIVPNAGNRLIIVKVNPRDVVSVPNFEKFTKMRVCEYIVLDEIKDVVKELDKIVYKGENIDGVQPVSPDNVNTTEDATDTTEDATDKDGIDPNKATTAEKRLMLVEGDNLDEYRIGYEEGLLDREADVEYGFSRDYEAGEGFRKGYNDGYNDRPDQLETDDADDDIEDNGGECDGQCNCCGCHDSTEPSPEDVKDSEYSAGYAVGEDDSKQDNGYQTNLNVDDTDSFKAGYSDGYNDAENAHS